MQCMAMKYHAHKSLATHNSALHIYNVTLPLFIVVIPITKVNNRK